MNREDEVLVFIVETQRFDGFIYFLFNKDGFVVFDQV